MLKKLELENFKSWKKVNFDLAPLTALFGANSSGKSSLIHFLLLLKQTKESSDRSLALDFGTQESHVNLGSFKDAVHRHDENARLRWHLSWQQPEILSISDPEKARSAPIFVGNDISLASAVSLRNKQVACDRISYTFAEREFRLGRKSDSNDFNLDADGYAFKRTIGRPWKLPGPIRSYAFPDQARTYFQNSLFLSDLENAYEQQINKIMHLGPLREYPQREYIWSGSSPLDVGKRGERVVEAILAATAQQMKRNIRRKSPLMPFQKMIAFWLKEMGLIESFKVEDVGNDTGLYRVHVRRDPQSAETLITDVGFGVSQVLPVLVLLYYVPEGTTILLEQPEIHLHPSVQASLADLIISAVQHRKIQVIVESHSEYFLHRLTRRIAEGDKSPYPLITPDDVKIYFCAMRNGTSRLEPLDLNLFGGIANWPEDFFGNTFEDIAARDKAALKRQLGKP